MFYCAEGLVYGSRCRAILFPGVAVPADGDDSYGLPVDDSGVAAAGVISAISGPRADLFSLGNLTEQFRQDRTVTVAAGVKLHCPDVRSRRIHGQMQLAPLAPALNTMLAGLPIKPGQAQEARYHSSGLPEWQLEQHLDRQAELDCRILENRWASWTALMQCVPRHLLVLPDQQRPAGAERSVVGGPVRRA